MDNQQFQPVQNQSIWTIILPTIIITALIVGGGVWWWQKSSFEKEKEELQQQIEELENQVSDTSDTSDTSDWKTYRNEEYGFSIKYPENWEEPIVMDYEKVSSLGREGVLSSANIDFYKDSVNKIGFNIIICKKDVCKNYEAINEGIGLGLKTEAISKDSKECHSPASNVLVGTEEYPAKLIYISPSDNCYQETYFYYLRKGDYDYMIYPFSGGKVGEDMKTKVEESLPEFGQILSTFKFTN